MISTASRTARASRAFRAATRTYATETVHSSPSPSAPPPPPHPQPKPASSHSTRTRAGFNPAPRTSASQPPSFLPYLSPTFGRNQLLAVSDATRELVEDVVSQFHAPIRYAFAYGSGVFKQDGYATTLKPEERPMLDFIFAVTHADHWHSINMNQFPHHYAFHSRLLGSSFVARVQEVSPGVWFNPYVTVNGVRIKYGVVTVDDLCSDLLAWRTLYLAGRMHKPIRIIKDDARVRLTQQVNLTSAVRTALLTLPSHFSERELFERIAGLSYGGDPRMLLPAENRGKVGNIVSAQGPQFHELYHRLVTGLPGVHWPSHSTDIQQDTAPGARAAHLKKLPSGLLDRVTAHYGSRPGMPARESDVYWPRMAGEADLGSIVQRETDRIVRYPAVVQTMKGMVSAGLFKTVKYSGEKVGKWWAGSSKPKASGQ